MNDKKRRSHMDVTTHILIMISGLLLIFMFIKDKNLAIRGLQSAETTLWDNLVILLV